MKIRYVTAAQADVMRRQVLEYFEPAPLVRFDKFRFPSGDAIEWHVVPDDDLRLQTTVQVSHTIK